MDSDLIAWVVAIALGVAVVGLGLRRNLSDLTRGWLPRHREVSEAPVVATEFSNSGHRHRQLSPGQRKFGIWFYLLLSLCNAAMAILWTHDRVLHATSAVLFAIGAVVFMLRSPSSSGA
jgi:hypothetical protein